MIVFHFSYAQTELNSILESGAGLNWNGAKTVWFKYITNTVAAKLDANTQLVLCDPNYEDQYYYSRLSDHRPETDNDGEKDIISFVNFKTSLTGGTSFIPATLNDMLLAQGFTIIGNMFSGAAGDAAVNAQIFACVTGLFIVALVFAVILSTPVFKLFRAKAEQGKCAVAYNYAAYVGSLLIFGLAILSLLSSKYNPFIYFRF